MSVSSKLSDSESPNQVSYARAWGHHRLGTLIAIIADLLQLARFNCRGREPYGKIEELLDEIEEVIVEIHELLMFPPLAERDARSVLINQLIKEHVSNRQERRSYENIGYQVLLNTSAKACVKINPKWLHRILEIVVDNAVGAMGVTQIRNLTITSQLSGDHIVIAIHDTGIGISKSSRMKLFQEPIEKRQGEKGLGLGLFLARRILWVYDGTIEIGSTGTTGTTVIIRLLSDS